MDVEKLIRRLRNDADAYRNGETLGRAFADQEDVLDNAATALSTLRAENEKLRDELEQERDHRLYAEEHADLFLEDCKRLNVELEQVKAERDAAVSWAQKYTESIDMPCVACKHNTGDYVCTAICGNCGPMGAESCKWEFDFSGELKED